LAELYESEPIPSELPLRNWAEQVIAAAIPHYNGKWICAGGIAGGRRVVADWDWIGAVAELWIDGGTQRAQYLSWVKDLDGFVASRAGR